MKYPDVMLVELIPVLEIPIMAQRRLREIHRPPATFQQNPIEWDEYQRQLLVSGGFADYERVVRGSHFISIDQWSMPDLRRLVQNHLRVESELIPTTESCSLFGGFILRVDGVPVFVPPCCGTLADFASWQGLLAPAFTSGYFCPEGHPNPQATKSGSQLLITCEDPYETFHPPTQAKIVVELAALTQAIAEAKRLMDAFANQLDLLSAELGVVKPSDYLVWATA